MTNTLGSVGEIRPQEFVAGTHYTAGVTNSLTLTNAPIVNILTPLLSVDNCRSDTCLEVRLQDTGIA